MGMTANTRGYNGENFNKFLNKREEENTTCPCVVFNCLPKRILFLLEKSQMKVDITLTGRLKIYLELGREKQENHLNLP